MSFWPELNCRTQKVYLEITLSKIRLDIYDKEEKKYMNQSKNILLDATIGPTFFFKEMFFLLILSVIGAKSV